MSKQTIGPYCPINLHDLDDFDPYVVRLSRWFDDDGHEQGERINGFEQCPRCGLWWPVVEEPDCWEKDGGRWVAIGWWGAAVCDECELLMVEQPDGRGECYSLKRE